MNKLRTCTVCQIESSDTYCGNCGQKIKVEKTTFFSMLNDLFSNAVDIEKSVIASIFIIIRTPSKIINNYWNGYRKYYPSPSRLLIYSLAVAALHLTYVDDKLFNISLASGQVDTQVLFWVLFLPLITTTSFLTFIRTKFNYTKHIISSIYISSAFFIILIVLGDLIQLITGNTFGQISFMLFLALVFIWNALVYTKKKKLHRIAFNVLIQILVLISLIVLLGIILSPFASVYNEGIPAQPLYEGTGLLLQH